MSKLSFCKYNSITNTYSEKFLNKVEQEGFASKSIEYLVTEKIHGANFSIYASDYGVSFASRTQILEPGASFYNIASITEELTRKASELFCHYQSTNTIHKDACLIIHGELAGASYPGFKSTQKRVQKGVFYSPNLEFFVFDLAILTNGTEESYQLLPQLEMWDYSMGAGFNVLQTLLLGNLYDCLKYSNSFNSTIPKMLGHPDLNEPNICEGIVIKPEHPLFLTNGNRVIFKSKNDTFSEKTKEPKVIIPLTDNQEALLAATEVFVTKQRLDNVLSKTIDFDFNDKRNIGVLIRAMMTDIFEEINNETTLLDNINQEDKKRVQNNINNLIKRIVLPRF